MINLFYNRLSLDISLEEDICKAFILQDTTYSHKWTGFKLEKRAFWALFQLSNQCLPCSPIVLWWHKYYTKNKKTSKLFFFILKNGWVECN